MNLQIEPWISFIVKRAADALHLEENFAPDVRPADPRFGDFQANGVLPYAKKNHQNPRELAEKLVAVLLQNEELQGKLEISIAGPGFINFKLLDHFLADWGNQYYRLPLDKLGLSHDYASSRVIIDYSSPNTAKQMHVGHLRSMNIGDSIKKILQFLGAEVKGDNHVGDWGTQFGLIIMALKQAGKEVSQLSLEEIESLYKEGNTLAKSDERYLNEARQELVKLQQGDPECVKIWQTINAISQASFEVIYQQADVHFDYTLGESFYRDQVERVYKELIECGLAEENQGALCVFHREHERFKDVPFIIRKADGASNYASTDLATVLYRYEKLHADVIIYVTDSRQQDHFQQLFLTVQKWFACYHRPCPQLRHVWFGTICGEDGKAIKTRDGSPVKLQNLFDESVRRSLEIVKTKSPSLSAEDQQYIAKVLGMDSVKYSDLLPNRTSDYVFNWDKMLSFDGNTAAYLLYAVARIKSILRKNEIQLSSSPIDTVETEEERALIRKLMYFPEVLLSAAHELKPHYICTYLFELTTLYSGFYNSNRILGESSAVLSRRLAISQSVMRTLETGMQLLGLKTLDFM